MSTTDDQAAQPVSRVRLRALASCPICREPTRIERRLDDLPAEVLVRDCWCASPPQPARGENNKGGD